VLSKPCAVRGQCLTAGLVCCWCPRSVRVRPYALQAIRRPAAEPEHSGHKPGLISNDARKGESAALPPDGRLHPGNVGHEALGGALARPQKRRGRQWVGCASGPQPSCQVRGSRPRVGDTSAARGRSQVVARLRVLWNLTSPVDETATPGSARASQEIIDSEPSSDCLPHSPQPRTRPRTTNGWESE
jgi:hypothetical protein